MSARYWVEFWLNNGAAAYVTYLLLSTILLGGVALAVRRERLDAATEQWLWRAALLTAPGLAVGRTAAEHVGSGPASGPAVWSVAGTAGWLVIWTACAAVLVSLALWGRFGRAAAAERRRLADRRPVSEPDVLRVFRAVAATEGPGRDRRRARDLSLSESDRLAAPVAIGRREICVPVDLFRELSPPAARAVLAHEIAHLERRDARWAALSQLLERVFFLQPLHRLASRRLRETAEFLADAEAVRAGDDPEPLVDALAWFARSNGDGDVLVAGFAPGSLLVRRVERVLSTPEVGRAWRLAGPTLLLAVVLLAWFAPAVAPACDCRWPGL